VRRELHGDVTYFNINRHINPTNICVYTYNCKFCSFAALKDEPHAWAMTHEQIYAKAAEQGGNKVTEFHIVGGLHPDLSLEWYLEMLRGLKQRFPDAHLKAFTAIEIGWFAKREKLTIQQTLETMREAGLGSLPGGGAEIFHPEVREIICDGNSTPRNGSRSTASPIRSASRPTARCSTATSSASSTRSTTCCACARSRTSRRASTPSSRSPTTPRTTTWG
jgi:2-iminoacetate synthase ThiH